MGGDSELDETQVFSDNSYLHLSRKITFGFFYKILKMDPIAVHTNYKEYKTVTKLYLGF